MAAFALAMPARLDWRRRTGDGGDEVLDDEVVEATLLAVELG